MTGLVGEDEALTADYDSLSIKIYATLVTNEMDNCVGCSEFMFSHHDKCHVVEAHNGYL